MSELLFGVITVSDTCSQDAALDRSGPALREALEKKFPSCRITFRIIPDEQEMIQATLVELSDHSQVHAVFTTGGTGFAPRDVTPEATRRVIDKEAPQLAQAMLIASLAVTPMAPLSRAVCGVRKNTLIVNLPGSPKAVRECLEAIFPALPHAINLLRGDSQAVTAAHKEIQRGRCDCSRSDLPGGKASERGSKYPMVELENALEEVFNATESYRHEALIVLSPLSLPPFRASIKDGYAVKSSSGGGRKRVLGSASAGEFVIGVDFPSDACFKINTGAPVPRFADAIVQVEDTKVLEMDGDHEKWIEILTDPVENCDIREIGCDIEKGEELFTAEPPFCAGKVALAASVGLTVPSSKPIEIAIISTGDELVASGELGGGQIYDSNTPMLRKLLQDFGFNVKSVAIAGDSFDGLKWAVEDAFKGATLVICSGGVSMGDKDFVKSVLMEMDFDIRFGRVNMKPGKPVTFAVKKEKLFFGLPGNPVSTFVTFHLLVLPMLRFISNHPRRKCQLPVVKVKLLNETLELDPRPEFMRATVKSIEGELWVSVTGNQISSRLKSLIDADVLVHIPMRDAHRSFISKGTPLNASILKHYFISETD